MRLRWAFVGFVVLLAVTGVPGASADMQDQESPSRENTVGIRVNPGGTDTVTRYFLADETPDPAARARRLAGNADLPVYGVSVGTVEDRVTVWSNGRIVDGGDTYYETEIRTDLGVQRGAFAGAVTGETLSAIVPEESAQVVVVVKRGTTVSPATPRDTTLLEQGYEVDDGFRAGDDAITYRLSSGSLPALGGLLVGSFLIPFVLTRLYALSVAGRDWPEADRLHRVQQVALVSIALAPSSALLVANWLGALSLTSFLLEWASPVTLVGDWVTVTRWGLAMAPFAGLAWLASSIGPLPAYNELRGSDQSHGAFLVAWVKQFAFGAVALWVAAVVVVALSERILDSPAFGGLVVGTLFVLYQAASPYLVRLFDDIEPVDDELATEIETFCSQQGVEIVGTYRIDTGDARQANGFAAGVPGRYWVFLTDDLVEELDPAARRAVVAHELGHLNYHHLLQRAGFSAVFWLVALAIHGAVLGSWVWLVLAFLCYLYPALGWVTHRQEYEADEFAAELTSPETVVEMLEKLASVNKSRHDTGGIYNLLTRHPSFDDRIRRIQRAVNSSGEETSYK